MLGLPQIGHGLPTQVFVAISLLLFGGCDSTGRAWEEAQE